MYEVSYTKCSGAVYALLNQIDVLKAYYYSDYDTDESGEKLRCGNDFVILEYEDYQTMIRDLYAKEVDYIFLPTNYASIFGQLEEYETLEEATSYQGTIAITFTLDSNTIKNASTGTYGAVFKTNDGKIETNHNNLEFFQKQKRIAW